MLKKRFLTALWGIPLVILVVWFSRPEYPAPLFTVLAAAYGLLAAYEFFRITGVLKNRPLTVFGLVWTLLFILLPHCSYAQSLPILLSSGVFLSLILLVFLPRKEGVFNHWAWMMAGILYVGWLLGILVTLRLDSGRNWLYLALFATFASDSAAYFIGKALGRHKLAPDISPGKTREGAIAGLCGAVIISLLFTLDTPLQLPLSIWQAIVLGLLVSVFGQIGDLAESLLKRNTGVKDSGTLMPGHGGLLDRMDSIVFAGVVVYYFSLLLK
jgi:phosphatidate cytidylyltransferase